MNISVEKAVNLIDSTLQLHKSDHLLPYFFIIGAGVSAPEIPLAGRIVELCKEEIQRRNSEYYAKCVEEMRQYESNAMKNYSGWIERAYPNGVDRSRFFKSIIAEAKISSANLMLAHILYSKKIATTVFTTNFDDKLKQALELIGVTDLFVAENAMDNLVINPQAEDIQVIHVHGTYNFYDCANLEEEIQLVANQSNTISSSRVLSTFLLNQAPIIVGYSGWENDVIMTCLKERLSYPTPLRYIWVCYSKESYNTLPQWLKCSSSVDFIIPEINDLGCEDVIEGRQFVQSESQNKRSKIDATKFFSLLISSIKLGVPEIFENPFSYYSKRIDGVLPQHEDVLHLRHWANRMKYLGSSDSPFEKLVKKLEHADVTNDLNSATSILEEISKLNLPIADVRFTSETLIKGLLEKESVFETFEEKHKFRLAVLDFIETNYAGLLEEGILNFCLSDVFLYRLKKEDCDDYFSLLDRVCMIAKKDISLLGVQLTAMGLKSTIAADKQLKISLLNEIIELSSMHMDDPSILYLHCIALYNLAELSPEAKAIELIKSADELIHQDRRQYTYIKAMKSKSKVLNSLTDENLQIKWIKNIIVSIEKNMDLIDSYDVLRISSNLSHLPTNLLTKVDGIIDYLSLVFNKCKILDYNYFEHALWESEICTALIDLSDDAIQKLSYCNDLKIFIESIPIGCAEIKQLKSFALNAYCTIPVGIVTDQLKVKEIQQFKQDYPDDKEAVIDSLLLAYKNGDPKTYENCVELQEEVDYCAKISILSSAYNQYTSKDFEHAEKQFISIINCGYAEVETRARNNLAFMIRRHETVAVQDSFWDIIKDASNDLIFKHMNIILYCISEGLTDDARYKTSQNYLSTMTHEDAISLYEFWGDVELVGKPESELALKVIAEANKTDSAFA